MSSVATPVTGCYSKYIVRSWPRGSRAESRRLDIATVAQVCLLSSEKPTGVNSLAWVLWFEIIKGHTVGTVSTHTGYLD
jgi:hypothetical protein